jgi:hypothetical protein
MSLCINVSFSFLPQALFSIKILKPNLLSQISVIYEPQHPKIEDCEEWRVVYITQNHMAILVSKENKNACIFLDLLDKSGVSGWLKITEY